MCSVYLLVAAFVGVILGSQGANAFPYSGEGSGFADSVSNSVTDEIYADVSSGSNSKDYDHLYMSLRYGWNNDDEDAPGGNEASGAGASKERAGKIGTNAEQLSIKQLITLQKPADRMNMAKIKKGEGK